MKKMQQAQPEFTTDADGQQLVRVALANTDQRATLHAEDYQRWIGAGFSRHWSLNDNGNGSAHVKADGRRADGRKTKLRVARLIAGAGKGEHVRFADGNTLNLRADNLRIHRARARYGCGDLLPNAAAVEAAREQSGEQRVTTATNGLVPHWARQHTTRGPARNTKGHDGSTAVPHREVSDGQRTGEWRKSSAQISAASSNT